MASKPDICARRHKGNRESVAAHSKTNTLKDKARIIARFERLGRAGATCDDIELLLGMAHQTASPRITELKKAGILVPKPLKGGNLFEYERRLTRTGSTAAVWVLAAYAKNGARHS
jgi:predicted transcriptional regulator